MKDVNPVGGDAGPKRSPLMRITIFGAGNLGLASCAVLAQDNDVTLFTAKPHKNREALDFTYEGKPGHSAPFAVTDDIAAACQADMILCTYPAFLRQQFVADIEPYVQAGTSLGFMPGYGGIEYFCQDLIARGVTVFGLQRVPYVSRSSWSDRTAGILSAKTTLYVAALPKDRTADVARTIEGLFHIPTVPLKEFLAVTLVPSNPLLHTSGAYGVFKDYRPGDTYPEQLMFYEQWNDDTSRFLLAYDDELQAICRALAPLDLSEVVSLREYYESPTPEAMTAKLKSIRAFEAVKVPLSPTDEGTFVPNWNDRMFTEDYPFGVAIIKDIASMAGVPTPTIDTLLDFYREQTGIAYIDADGTALKDASASAMPRTFGLTTKEAFVKFYQS